jgi:hypothetical protein
MAQLSKLVFVDYLGAFASALRDGRFRAVRERQRYPLYWEFCFDYATHLAAFAAAVDGTVTVHDFRDADPFPGHSILTALGIDSTTLALPGGKSRNVRLARHEAEANRIAQLRTILEAAQLEAPMIEELAGYLRISPELEATFRTALHRLYAAGMEQVLTTKTLSGAVNE